jgi:radical SAM superfamily enzyme YgiQ (UPF0313 family)
MKICLVSSGPNENLIDREKNKAIAAFPPLGLLYLATILRENGIDVSILDQPGQGLTIDETTKWILQQTPDVLGFSALTSSGITAALISKQVKQKNPNIKIVIGNHYATFNPERILKQYPQIDIVVRGEGEQTIIQLVSCLEKDGDLSTVKGIHYRKNQIIIANPDQPLTKNLDTLPFPDRSLIDVEYHCVTAGAFVARKSSLV